MKKVIRYFIIAFVVAIVFVAGSAGIFIALFDARDYQDDLVKLVHEKTGRSLQFHGDVGLTLFPALGLKLGAISVSNPPSFADKPMIKIKEAAISVDMASLVKFAPEVEQLVLRDLEIDLITNKSGDNNWDDLIPAPQAASESPSATATPQQNDFDIQGAFGGLDLQNIKLHWLDEQNASEYRVNDLDINTGRITADAAFPLRLRLDASASGGVEVLVELNTNIQYQSAAQSLALTEIQLALNEFQVSGQVELSELANVSPSLRFELQSPGIDVDALLGTPAATPVGPAADTPAPTTADAKDLQIQLPMQTLRDLNIDGRLSIAEAKLQNLNMNNVEITIKAQDGQVGLKPFSMDAYGGRVEVVAAVDVRSPIPNYQIEKSIQGLQVGDLLNDYQGVDTISGTLNAQADVSTSGEWLSEINKNSNGRMALEFLDGAVKGFNLRQSIDAAKANLRGEEPAAQATLKTDFASLSVSGPISNGVFSSDDLDLQAPLLRVGGKGSADLNTNLLDYRIDVKLVGAVTGQQGEAADELAGLSIPVSIKGPFDAVKIDVLLDNLLKAQVDAEKEALKADIERQKDELAKQIEAEKKSLAESKKRELDKKRELEAVKARQKLNEKKDKAKKKLGDKVKKLFD